VVTKIQRQIHRWIWPFFLRKAKRTGRINKAGALEGEAVGHGVENSEPDHRGFGGAASDGVIADQNYRATSKKRTSLPTADATPVHH